MVDTVLVVVSELADAANLGPGLGVGVVEGHAVVDGGAHAPELGLAWRKTMSPRTPESKKAYVINVWSKRHT